MVGHFSHEEHENDVVYMGKGFNYYYTLNHKSGAEFLLEDRSKWRALGQSMFDFHQKD